MSLEHTETVICPKCSKRNQIKVWQTLNGDLDPDAKQQLIEGTLFRFKCQRCCHVSNLNYELLYHDMKHQAMVYYVSLHSIEEINDMINATEETLRGGMSGYRVRIATSQETLREKAMIFESGLDDRIVEIMKLFVLSNARDKFPEAIIEDVYFSLIRYDELVFELVGAKTLGANIPIALYKKLREDYKAKLELVSNIERMINLEWAVNFIK